MTNADTYLLTIYTEASLESKLIEDLNRMGATGYTISNARGKGNRGVRSGSWDADANIRVEVLGEQALTVDIANHLQRTYYENFAMVMWTTPVNVFRPTKFER